MWRTSPAREAERLDLLERRLLEPRPAAASALKAAPSWRGLRDVLDAEAGVDQDQPVVGLDQQAVADDLGRLAAAALAVDQARARAGTASRS